MTVVDASRDYDVGTDHGNDNVDDDVWDDVGLDLIADDLEFEGHLWEDLIGCWEKYCKEFGKNYCSPSSCSSDLRVLQSLRDNLFKETNFH